MISVLMSTYNEKIEEVEAAVDSIMCQSYQEFELIVVLDNPENRTLNQWILEKMSNSEGKIKCIEHLENQGLVQSLNDALSIANGEYIARMDADDVSMPTRFEKQLHYMKVHTECAVLGCNRVDMDQNGVVLNVKRQVLTSDKLIKKCLKYGVPFTHPSIMVRKDVLKSLGGYRNIVSAEDYDLYLRCKKAGYGFANLNEELIMYRIRQNGISLGRAYEMLIGKKYAYDLYRFGEKAMRRDGEIEEKRKNYEEYVHAIRNRKMGWVLKAIMKDKILIDELYRNFMFKLLYKLGGSNAN